MTWYSPYNTYSNQMQYYNPYNYSSYYSTPYTMMTDGSFQNRYYTVDGTTGTSVAKRGFKLFLGLLKFGIRIGTVFLGGDSGDLEMADTMIY